MLEKKLLFIHVCIFTKKEEILDRDFCKVTSVQINKLLYLELDETV